MLFRVVTFVEVLQRARGNLSSSSSVANVFPPHKFTETRYTATPIYSCPDDSIFSNGKCIQLTSRVPLGHCALGWTLNVDTNICEGYEDKAPELICPAGSEEGGKCSELSTSEKIAKCPNSAPLFNGQCVEQITQPATAVCDSLESIYDPEKSLCLTPKISPTLTRCPTAYHFEGDSCVNRSVAAAQFHCPASYTRTQRNGLGLYAAVPVCTQAVSIPAVPSCETGFTLHSKGKCVRLNQQPARSQCSEGILTTQGCIVEERYAATPFCANGGELLGMQCRSYETVEATGSCTKGARFDPVSRMCYHATGGSKKAAFACPKGFKFAGKYSCAGEVMRSPMFQCANGGSLMGTECTVQHRSNAQLVCDNGGELVGTMCVAKEVSPISYHCNNGYQLEGSHCVGTTDAHASPVCPSGYNMDKLLAKQAPATACTKVDVIPVVYGCPRGSSKTVISGTTTCSKVVETAPTYTCLDGTFSLNSESNVCVKEVKRDPILTCPSGLFEDRKSGSCYSKLDVPAIKVCDPGYDLIDSRCIKKVTRPMENVCGDDSKLSNDNITGTESCSKLLVIDPHVTCDLGYTYDNLKKECYYVKSVPEFDLPVMEDPSSAHSIAQAEEQFLDLSVPQTPLPQILPTPPPTKTVSIVVERPLIQTGYVVRQQPILIEGRLDDVRAEVLSLTGEHLTDEEVEEHEVTASRVIDGERVYVDGQYSNNSQTSPSTIDVHVGPLSVSGATIGSPMPSVIGSDHYGLRSGNINYPV